MKRALLILSTFFSTYLLAQTGEIEIVKIDTSFTWSNSTIAEIDSFYFNLPFVKYSSYKTHIRISFKGQTIDFFSGDNETFQGLLTNRIFQCGRVKDEWGKHYVPKKYVFQKISIDESLSTKIAKQILNSGQVSIPTDSLIPSWKKNDFLHCWSLEFQFLIDGNFYEQYFTCPLQQRANTMFADVVASNYQLLYKELDLEKRYDEFKSQLARGKTYTYGHTTIYVMTKRQSKAWQKDKPRRDYLESIKDSIDSYLNTYIKEQQLGKNYCFVDFQLTINKKGKLQKVKVPKSDRPKISDGLDFYFEDKIDMWRCRKRTRAIFKDVNLSSFHLKYKVHRRVTYDSKGEIRISD